MYILVCGKSFRLRGELDVSFGFVVNLIGDFLDCKVRRLV